MIHLITGVPGSGKTLRTLWWLTQDDYLAEDGTQRPVYSNIPGTDHLPLPPGEDWRDTPEGSIVIYDEAQQFFPATGRAGNSNDPRVQALETHRHTGHDLIFITQRYALVHHHIRSLVGRYEWVLRKTKKMAVVFKAGEVFDPRDRNKIKTVEESIWKYPTELFDKYHSASIHTKAQTKTRIPVKIKILGSVILVLVSLAVFLGYESVSNILSASENPAQAERPGSDQGMIENAVKTAMPGNVPTGTRIVSQDNQITPAWQKKGREGLSGCVASETSCQCFDAKGLRVDLPEGVCRHQVDQPMISRITGFDNARRPSQSDRDGT